MSYNRGELFVRATEIRSITEETKEEYINCVSSMLTQINIINYAQPKNFEERVDIAEKMFLTIMKFPEILTQYPRYRKTIEEKIDILISEIKFHKYRESKLLNDARYFMKMITARPDYDNPSYHKTTRVSHKYNLRPRNKRISYVY